MSRRRKYGEDLTYAEAHRNLPDLSPLYSRVGHRLDMADRDWTEFCHHCKEPLGLYEEVRDVGQDLNDKATTVTRKLAAMAKLPAILFAWRAERPPHIQDRINRLHQEIRKLEAAYPITGFKAKRLWPRPAPLVALTPEQWWEQGVLILHRQHHQWCPKAQSNGEIAVRGQQLADAKHQSQLWPGGVPGQLVFPGPAAHILQRKGARSMRRIADLGMGSSDG